MEFLLQFEYWIQNLGQQSEETYIKNQKLQKSWVNIRAFVGIKALWPHFSQFLLLVLLWHSLTFLSLNRIEIIGEKHNPIATCRAEHSVSETKFPELAKKLIVGLFPPKPWWTEPLWQGPVLLSRRVLLWKHLHIRKGSLDVYARATTTSESKGEAMQHSLPCTHLVGVGGGLVSFFMREVKVGRSDRKEKQITQDFQELNCP